MTRIGLSVITCVARAQNGSRHVRICHDLQKRSLGPRRMSASLSLAGLPRGRSFPLPRTGRPFQAYGLRRNRTPSQYGKAQEEEAGCLSAALLVPREAMPTLLLRG